jgi:hypothetical protein
MVAGPDRSSDLGAFLDRDIVWVTEEPVPQDALIVLFPVPGFDEVGDVGASPVSLEKHRAMGPHSAAEPPSARFQRCSVGLEVVAVLDANG